MMVMITLARAQPEGFFQYRPASAGALKKSQVAGRFGSGISVEIFNQVISRYLFYSQVFRVYTMFGFAPNDTRLYTKLNWGGSGIKKGLI